MLRDLILGLILLCCLTLPGGGCSGDDDPVRLPDARVAYLHVATTGRAQARGTADDPLQSIGVAVERAYDGGYRGVKVATGTYPWEVYNGALRLRGGVDIIGGCDPVTWQPVAGASSDLAIPGAAALGLGIRTPTVVRGLVLHGSSSSGNSPTSIALYLEGCGPELRFESCRFTGRTGRGYVERAQDGSEANPLTPPTAGGDGSCAEAVPGLGGERGRGGCSGGTGGDGGLPGEAGTAGGRNCYGIIAAAPGGEPGLDGAAGPDGPDGADGANGAPVGGLGSLGQGRLNPPNAGSGDWGDNGQGGGGGGGGGGAVSGSGAGNGGGGGGSGGRGGRSGSGGGSGGHSIGVLCVDAAVTFIACEFTGGDGGAGQDGGYGAAGQDGDEGAPGGEACPGVSGRGGHGGRGGQGGGGGAGAGGNGGGSFGLLVFGPAVPTTDAACVFDAGAAGTAGVGGLHGNGVDRAPDGRAGEAAGRYLAGVDPGRGAGAAAAPISVARPRSRP